MERVCSPGNGTRVPSGQAQRNGVNTRDKLQRPEVAVYCHWCRHKIVNLHVRCSTCSVKFCGYCLQNRHGENVELEMYNDAWVCPRCRGGCGPGCSTNCCNCGKCRKAMKLPPTGQIVKAARENGFTNVHDYLVHLETNESAKAIAKRKEGRGWTSTEPLSGVTVDEEHQQLQRLAWARTKIRSTRWLVANSRWGRLNSSTEGIQAERLVMATMRARFDVGKKQKILSNAKNVFSSETRWQTPRFL